MKLLIIQSSATSCYIKIFSSVPCSSLYVKISSFTPIQNYSSVYFNVYWLKQVLKICDIEVLHYTVIDFVGFLSI